MTDLQTPYTYVFIRQDLPLAAQIVQACHACLDRGFSLPENKKPLKTSFLVLFGVRDAEELEKIADYLDRNEVSYEQFYEPDYDMGYTSICTEPMYNEQRKLYKKFKLWKQ